MVFWFDGRLYRSVSPSGRAAYETITTSPFVENLVSSGRLVPFSKVAIVPSEKPLTSDKTIALLEHEPLEFISHPYEWPFSALKAAALFHLELQLDALAHGISLIDASAYNVQFNGAKPIFIDHLSFRPYEQDSLWLAHRQFCEQFLNPLLLQSKVGIPFNDWCRGNLEGIPGNELTPLLPIKSYLSLKTLTHVVLPAIMDGSQRITSSSTGTGGRLPVSAFRSMLNGLHKWISTLEPKNTKREQWRDYEKENSYSDEETQLKQEFVAEFSSRVRPQMLWDLGCNMGQYSAIALSNGVKSAIGFDSDFTTLHHAYARAFEKNLNFLPLHQRFQNPSPNQGWLQKERLGLQARQNADAVLALALIHHHIISKNIPMADAIKWIIDLAPSGIVEFVPKSDPMVQAMSRNRPDVADRYSEELFANALTANAAIVKEKRVSENGRWLVWYNRNT